MNPEVLERQLSYWRSQLAGLPPLLELPTDRLRPVVPTYRGATLPFATSKQLHEHLQELSRQAGVTMFMTLLSGFAVLLSRYANQTDVAIGTRAANTLVLRSDLSDEPRFVDLLKRTHETVLRAYAHQDVPFERVMEALGHSPLFQVSLGVNGDGVANCDLTLNVHESAEGLTGELTYNANLFERSTMERLLEHYAGLLQAIVTQPEERVSRYEFLSDAEKHQQLVEWNATRRSYPHEQCIHELFEAQVRKTPDAIALCFEGCQLTYDALNRAANRVAHYLMSIGVGPEQRIGLCVERSPEMVIGILGILKAGGVYVPLDPAYPPEHIADLLDDSGVQLVLTREHLLANQPEHDISSSTRIAYLIYTSASTGKPKGVLGSHRGIVNRVHWLSSELALGPDEIFCQRAGIGSVDHVAEVFQPLAIGAALVILPDAALQDANAFVQALANHRITHLSVLPSTLRALMGCEGLAKVRSLKYVFSTGDVLPAELARRFFKCFSRARLFNVYGSTEVGADVSCHEVGFDAHVDIAGYFRGSPSGSWDDAQPAPHFADLDAELGDAVTRSHVPLSELTSHFADAVVPRKPLRPEEYVEHLKDLVLPHLVNVSSSAFIGHMTSALPAFMPELSKLIARLNQNMVKVETSKALTLLERQVLAMMHKLFFQGADADCQDPNHVFGVVTSGGTIANITALVCARNLSLLRQGTTKRELAERGATVILRQQGFSRAVLLASRLAHYSIKKTASLLGLGENDIVFIDQDAEQRLCIQDLRRRIEKSRADGELIIALIGIAGATETGTIDPLEDMARIANEYGAHFHVDAAWGGGLMFSDQHRDKLKGIERADTVTFCAHKQLYTPQGLSLCLFRDPFAAHASSVHAAYQARPGSYDMGQYSFEGSRPASSLLLHAALHLLAGQGFGWLMDRAMAMTAQFRALIESSDAFELVGTPQINIVNYRYVPRELRGAAHYSVEQNRAISQAVEKIQEQQFLAGQTFVSRTVVLNRQYCPEPITVFRVVLANPLTTFADLQRVLHDQLQIAQECTAPAPLKNTALLRDESQPRIPIGRPISNSRIYILDKLQQLVPVGVTGEICVAGDSLAAGYLCADSLLAQSFVSNPFEPGERLYRTGDLGRLRADGSIEFLGRADRQVKIRGFRVELDEIEAQLLRIDGVFDCAVLARPLDGFENRLVAYVVPARKLTAALLRDALAQAVPEYRVPDVFVLLQSLPLTRRGKVDRRNLIEEVA
jgi:putative pyridoxal-dependent aspartate 1-decarboxylase